MQEDYSTYDFQKDLEKIKQMNISVGKAQLSLAKKTMLLNKKISSLQTKYSIVETAQHTLSLKSPSYRIKLLGQNGESSLFAFHNILESHPLVEGIEYSKFRLRFSINGKIHPGEFNGKMIITRKMQGLLICLIEAMRMSGSFSENQRTHYILPELFRKKKKKYISERSISNPANDFNYKIKSMMASTNRSMNDCILAVLSKKFTKNLPELKTIFGK